jgi:hypothetical protein
VAAPFANPRALRRPANSLEPRRVVLDHQVMPHDTDDFRTLIRQRIAAAYGPEVFDSPEFDTGPGSYLAARAAYEASTARFVAELPARAAAAAEHVTSKLRADGVLPADVSVHWELRED